MAAVPTGTALTENGSEQHAHDLSIGVLPVWDAHGLDHVTTFAKPLRGIRWIAINIMYAMTNKFISRDITAAIKEAFDYFSVITVTGPRQSGKTTLIKNTFPDMPYYSLENIQIREFANNDPMAFIRQHPQGMILDEVQNTPDLLSYIQGIVDDNPDAHFVLSGSSQFAMLQRITQSLAGRTAIFELLPLSLSEVADAATAKTLDEMLFDGFYPAVYSGRNIPRLMYPAYIKTYLEKDVRYLLNIKDLMQFYTFLRLCANRIGSVLKASELANEIGISSHTVTSWLSVLQASYVVQLLPPYFDNSRKRLTKAPKLYFCDTGLACSLLDIENAEQLRRDKMRGSLFENFVVNEALKQRYNKGKTNNLFFYRDSNQNEIDLLIARPDGIDGVEVKSSMTYHEDFAKALKQMPKWIKQPVAKRAIVYAGDYENNASDIQLLNYAHLDHILK